MEKITITRALTTLKTLSKKIDKATRAGEYITFEINGKKDSDANQKASLQKVTDLIEYYNRLKAGIAASNAVSKVKVGKNKISVVAAIEQKKSIEYKVKLLNTLRAALANTRENVDYHNQDAERRLDKLVEASVGSDNTKKDEIEAIAKPFMKRNEAKIVDPLKLEEVIAKLDEEIEDFMVNIDVALTESNSTTYIEV